MGRLRAGSEAHNQIRPSIAALKNLVSVGNKLRWTGTLEVLDLGVDLGVNLEEHSGLGLGF
jgi:hypothetical protein